MIAFRWHTEIDALKDVWAHLAGWHEPVEERPRVQRIKAPTGPVIDPHLHAAHACLIACHPHAEWLGLTYCELHPPVQEWLPGRVPGRSWPARSARAYERLYRDGTAAKAYGSRLPADGTTTWAHLVAERVQAPVPYVRQAVDGARRAFRSLLQEVDLHPESPRWLIGGCAPICDTLAETVAILCQGPVYQDGTRINCNHITKARPGKTGPKCEFCAMPTVHTG